MQGEASCRRASSPIEHPDALLHHHRGAPMTLQIVGAGLPRTGTHSLKVALEQLLGGRCYHMAEVFGRPQDVPVWTRALEGQMPSWSTLFEGYAAAVDYP